MLATLSTAAGAADAPRARNELTIEGVKPLLEEAIRSGLTLQQYRERAVSDAQLKRLITVGEKETSATLEAWGYYDGRIATRMEKSGEGGFHVWFKVQTGEPVLVAESTVTVNGEAGKAEAVTTAVHAFAPKIGERFDHAQYEASKAAIETALADSGFLGAKLGAHRVELRATARTARIMLEWSGGPRYSFGQTTFTGGQFPEGFLQRFSAWKEGDPYSSAKVLDLQRRLVGADYFGTVTVQPHPEKAVELAVPVEVTLTPARRTIYSAATRARPKSTSRSACRRWY